MRRYMGKDVVTGEDVAIKLEANTKNNAPALLLRETKIYRSLQGAGLHR